MRNASTFWKRNSFLSAANRAVVSILHAKVNRHSGIQAKMIGNDQEIIFILHVHSDRQNSQKEKRQSVVMKGIQHLRSFSSHTYLHVILGLTSQRPMNKKKLVIKLRGESI